MAFVSAMTQVGVNGANVLTEAGVGDVRVSLFTMLVRGLEASYIESSIASAPAEWFEDFCVMAFQLRDIRGGKGERDLFYAMMQALCKRNTTCMEALIDLVPEYGCWRDLWTLYDNPDFRGAILTKIRRQWAEDSIRTDTKSLMAKWLPRESSSLGHLARPFADALFPHIPVPHRMATYRKEVAKRNRELRTAEIDMCGKTWASITPAHVPGRSLKLHNAAFFNLKLGPRNGKEKRMVKQNQRSDDPDRIACREHFLAHLESLKKGGKAKGAHVVMPHEIVHDIQKYQSTESIELLEAQWVSIREAAGALGKVVPMCDFSGSMAGLPLQVSLALGILISEVAHPSFRDHILTFDSKPAWHSFASQRLSEKVRSATRFGQGLSTDFYKACKLILERMESAKVPVGEEPDDLIVLTDMGWDAAHKAEPAKNGNMYGYSSNTDSWCTQITQIRAEFAEASRRVWGEGPGWKVPRIVIWNLRAEYKEFHAAAADDGVVMISGWSPNILKALQKEGLKTMTPYAGMRAVLDDPRYDPVRAVVRSLLIEK